MRKAPWLAVLGIVVPVLAHSGCCLTGGCGAHGGYGFPTGAIGHTCSDCDIGEIGCESCEPVPCAAECDGYGHGCGLHFGSCLTRLFSRFHGCNSCGSGCGEVYWHDWINHPPTCDPCDSCGHWNGIPGQHAARAPGSSWLGLGGLGGRLKGMFHRPCQACAGVPGQGELPCQGGCGAGAGCGSGGCSSCGEYATAGGGPGINFAGGSLGDNLAVQQIQHNHGRPPHPVLSRRLR